MAKENAVIEAVSQCLKGESFADDPTSCVAISFDNCIAFTDGSRVDESDCLWLEASIWQSIYQDYVMAMLVSANKLDGELAMLGSAQVGSLGRAMRAEVAWESFRQAQCDMEMSHWGAGTIVTTERPLCMMRVTVERIARLGQLGARD